MIDRPLYPQHTAEQPRAVSSTAVVSTVLGTVAVVVAINALAGAYLQRYPPIPSDAVVAYKWSLVEQLEEPVDWLILGDSTGSRGIVPEQFSGALDGTVINAATNLQWSKVDDLILLSAHIEQVGPPHHVVLVYSYQEYRGDFDYRILAQLPSSFSRRMAAPIEREHLSPTQRADLALRRSLPLLFRSGSLQGVAQAGWFQVEGRGQLGAYGNQIFYGAEPDRVAASARAVAGWSRESFRLSPVDSEYLNAVGTLAAEHNFTVYLANSPIFEGVAALPAAQAYFDSQDDVLSTWADQHESVIYLSNRSAMPATLLQDYHHVTYEGAEIFTAEIAALIARWEE